MTPQDDEQTVRDTFKVFDPENTGYVNPEEFLSAFTTLGDVMETKDVNEIMEALERTEDGMIKFDSLVSLMVS